MKKHNRGFTLIFSVLISSILVALGSAIFDLVSKEIILSSAGRESQFAFYAADTGIECALYWDYKQNAFSTTSALTQVLCDADNSPAPMGGHLTRVLDNSNPAHPILTTTFSFVLNGVNVNPSTDVQVVRTYYPTQTTINSYGHNTGVLTDPSRLERAIRVTY